MILLLIRLAGRCSLRCGAGDMRGGGGGGGRLNGLEQESGKKGGIMNVIPTVVKLFFSFSNNISQNIKRLISKTQPQEVLCNYYICFQLYVLD